ncbi:MAG: FAD-dependent oxidoreductase [Acidobacteria bacterium]|nr:MAG: FAD-dependent oxidoreductase [Acidobacteriota bacterium]
MKTVLVVGAGLSGLSAAWHLVRRGAAVHVVCADAEPGGLIRTRRTPLGLVETGANSLVLTERARQFCGEIGVALCEPRRESARRYVYRDGRPRRFPLTVGESIGGVMSFVGAMVSRSTRARDGESVAAWGHRVVGRAVTDRLLAPVLQGVYAAPADRLSARAVLGSRRGRKGGIGAPATGMGEIIERLSDRLSEKGVRIEYGVTLDRVTPSERAIICTAAPAAAGLLAPHAPELAAAVGRIDVGPALTVTAFFERAATDLRGFGVLFPRGAGINALGVLFNDDIFPGRSSMRSETWILGASPAANDSDEAILASCVLPDRERLMGSAARPVACHVTRWPQGIPVYDDAVLAAGALVGSVPAWLGVAGNYLGRIGAAALIEVSEEAATRVLA